MFGDRAYMHLHPPRPEDRRSHVTPRSWHREASCLPPGRGTSSEAQDDPARWVSDLHGHGVRELLDAFGEKVGRRPGPPRSARRERTWGDGEPDRAQTLEVDWRMTARRVQHDDAEGAASGVRLWSCDGVARAGVLALAGSSSGQAAVRSSAGSRRAARAAPAVASRGTPSTTIATVAHGTRSPAPVNASSAA
jgi:hypothetical protein